MDTATFAESAGPSRAISQKACLPCRRVKMKCRLEPSALTCERCTRKSMECVFEEHRRGRKPGTRLIRRDQPALSPTSRHAPSRADLQRWPADITKDVGKERANDSGLQEKQVSSQNSTVLLGTGPISPTQNIWEASNPSQPDVLNVRAGTFSLQNVLSTTMAADSQEGRIREMSHLPPEMSSVSSLDDPIRGKILNFPIALGLFDSFMRSLNPFVSQFDPNLHTFEYVQHKSPFLLTSILAAASRAFHPPLHAQLRAHAEKLLGKIFMKGTKSLEIVQAILVATYWKDPDDSRSFLLIGYAIRMCIEMDWHKLEPIVAQPDDTQLSIREARNIRRTWLIIFVYDRSIGLQMGKPCMIEQNNFITTSHDWYKEPFAVFGADVLLCAFVSLRIISSEILESMSPYRARQVPQSGTLMRMLNANITRWEEKWLPVSEDEQVDRCQAFLIRFYGSHLRLLLNSFSLQDYLNTSSSGTSTSKLAVWTCYHSAIDMLQQISDRFGPLKLLYFAQDSVHMMTAYAASLLIKMLLSLPASFSKEFEASSIEAIRKTARTFDSQCATQMTGCALQARFLNNIAIQYDNMQYRPPKTAKRPQSSNLGLNNNILTPPDGPNTSPVVSSTANNQQPEQFRTAMGYSGHLDLSKESKSIGYEPDAGSWNFDDNNHWEEMFASAGYSIQDGVFMPDSVMYRMEN